MFYLSLQHENFHFLSIVRFIGFFLVADVMTAEPIDNSCLFPGSR